MNRFTKKLSQLREQSRYRSLNLPRGLDLTSNDYLGFVHDDILRPHAAQLITDGIALGAGGSRLLRGHQEAHADLEAFAAQSFGHEAALYFPTAFQANIAIFTALCGRHDTVIYDEYLHASARDGINACTSKSVRIPHNDLDAFESALQAAHNTRRADGHIWVAIETLYSMDGDEAPVAALHQLCQSYNATLIADEAHATGTLGPQGRGLTYGLGNVIALHACGKALGTSGGLLCANREVINYMINTARPFIYSTAPSPFQAALTQKSLEITLGAEGDKRRAQLLSLHNGQIIVPLILGEDARALKAAEILQTQGYDIRAIRPPTVPAGTARLRLSLSAAIDKLTLERFLEAFATCKNSL